MRKVGIGLAVLFGLAASAQAMGIRRDEKVLATSDDGKTALVEIQSFGPEGGGSLVYELRPSARPESFAVSEDFSPGDGSRPQRVSEKACAQTMAELGKRVAGWKAQVAVHPEVCARASRDGAVTVGKR